MLRIYSVSSSGPRDATHNSYRNIVSGLRVILSSNDEFIIYIYAICFSSNYYFGNKVKLNGRNHTSHKLEEYQYCIVSMNLRLISSILQHLLSQILQSISMSARMDGCHLHLKMRMKLICHCFISILAHDILVLKKFILIEIPP